MQNIKKFLIIVLVCFFSFLSGSIIERTQIYPVSEKINLFFEQTGLNLFKEKIKYLVLKKSKKYDSEKKVARSNYYNIVLKSIERPSFDRDGGIDNIDNKLIYVNIDGEGWIENRNNFIKIIKEKIPNNKNDFINKYNKALSISFGVKDILVIKKKQYLTRL